MKEKAQLARRSMRHQLGMGYREKLKEAEDGDRRRARGARAMRGADATPRPARARRAVEMIDQSKQRPGPGEN